MNNGLKVTYSESNVPIPDLNDPVTLLSLFICIKNYFIGSINHGNGDLKKVNYFCFKVAPKDSHRGSRSRVRYLLSCIQVKRENVGTSENPHRLAQSTIY